jgi:hypothetical protein
MFPQNSKCTERKVPTWWYASHLTIAVQEKVKTKQNIVIIVVVVT